MAQVCKWLGFYLCMKDAPKTDTVHPDCQAFDAVIVWREATKEKSGGLAYEVILKPASTDSPSKPLSPPKRDRPLSQEGIQKKLEEADERRQKQELAKLEPVVKIKERLVAANQKVDKLNREFSLETEKKLAEKLENMELKKSLQMRNLQERLKEHAKRVEEVRQTNDRYLQELKDRIDRKMENAHENREALLKTIQERLKDHELQIKKAMEVVQESKDKFSKTTEENLIVKMNQSIKNREEQLKQLQERLQEHDKHVQEIRKMKPESKE